jgi:hypothetical protein
MDPSSASNAVAGGSHDAVAIIGVMIPIVAIVMGLGIGMLKLWLDFRKKRDILQAHHAERMAAIEKGIDLPPLPPQFYGSDGEPAPDSSQGQSPKLQAGSAYLRSGLTWLLIVLAIGIALYADHDNHAARNAAWWGAVPAAFGLSRLLFYYISNRAAARADARGDQSKPQ